MTSGAEFPAGPPGPPERPDVAAAVAACAARGGWREYRGAEHAGLAAELAARFQAPHVELVASGTLATELALRGARVGPGAEVLLSAYDFKGNAAAVLALGATPVLIDADPCTGQMDVAAAELVTRPAVRAVVASHLHGGMVDMPRLRRLADARGWTLVEDCCQCPGATLAGRPAGGWGHAATLSFGGSKLLAASRGGAVLSGDPGLMQRLRLWLERGNHAAPLSELQAAALRPQLATLDADRARRAAGVAALLAEFGEEPALRPFAMPLADAAPDWYKLGFRCFGVPRAALILAAKAEGIALDSGFRAAHRSFAPSRFVAIGPLPAATGMDEDTVVLHHPALAMGAEYCGRVGRALRRAVHAAAASASLTAFSSPG